LKGASGDLQENNALCKVEPQDATLLGIVLTCYGLMVYTEVRVVKTWGWSAYRDGSSVCTESRYRCTDSRYRRTGRSLAWTDGPSARTRSSCSPTESPCRRTKGPSARTSHRASDQSRIGSRAALV
jgi:hypothetical protein